MLSVCEYRNSNSKMDPIYSNTIREAIHNLLIIKIKLTPKQKMTTCINIDLTTIKFSTKTIVSDFTGESVFLRSIVSI